MEILSTIFGGGLGPLFLVGFLGIALILGTLPFLINSKPDPLDKLKQSVRADAAAATAGGGLRPQNPNTKKLERFSSFLQPQDAEELGEMRQKLMRAGYRSKEAVMIFHFAQFALGLGLLAVGLVYYLLVKSGPNATPTQMMMWVLGPGCVGYMAPKYWVTKRQQERQEQITQGFPDSLDMMLVCVEAGQSMDQAIIRVSREIRASYPALADEFEIVSQQIKAGKDKANVLNEMAERCGVQDVSSFVTVLVQSQSFGTSIAEALRVYAGEMRDKRVMRAEEKANKLPTKMTLATMTLTVPPLLIILVAPSVVGITALGQ
ncbi:type II secretion system F family protein [Thalassovita mediterranea]|jgi:tight adherence protein C|uniref:Flp pilus assembly protein TadB n=1 Tax=Thalassovita mediterranea TaxID=340021 RepID=A0A0P1GNT9_9RHOB|nr:type II secretion system F family protein [Thalassovita mediterranea]MCG7575196.1 type II secretion system F family protein [Phaeobacter sp. CNT1-3]CUH83998.1 Flp pilus assembly protein TadB [Thalassovita mediterranea]SIS27930.1 tight adherence protein C [Thalassovita mediterranea]